MNQTLNHIRIALEAGNRSSAPQALAKYIQENPNSVDAWLLLANSLEDPEKVQYCLNRCLMIEPGSRTVLTRIRKFQQAKRRGVSAFSDEASPQLKKEESKYSQMLDKIEPPVQLPPLRKPGSRPVSSKVPPLDFDPDSIIKGREERKKANKAAKRKYYKPNWPLIIGALLSAIMIFLAIFGPDLAPKDPLEQNTVVKIEGEWHIPPIDPLTPGFPLGSDDIGRDILSRVLHGIRPTLQMVLAVAALRLVIGTIIGMIAGWNKGLVGKFLDSLISAALAVPVLIVALAGIAAVGVELGITAFIVGLTITGWVETARIVRDQTETIRGQQYIEAALALGLSPLQTIFKHVVRQILSIIWVLFAFEISSTLMLTGALGFLGYYIGGDIWVQVSDTAAAAYSGVPELGQMLATARATITQPWGIIAVGGVVFATVLGFNLIGEGLRNLRNIQLGSRSTAWKNAVGKITLHIDHHILYPIQNLMATKVFRLASLATAVLLSGVLIVQYIQYFAPLPAVEIGLPGISSQYWPASSHDPHGIHWTNYRGPQTPDIQWIYQENSGFSGPPTVTADGMVLILSNTGYLLGLDADMNQIWKIQLPEIPVGSPVLDAAGSVFIVDQFGGLLKLSSEGELLWRFELEEPLSALTNSTIRSDGTSFYPVENKIAAVSMDGNLLYLIQVPESGYINKPIGLSADEAYLFVDGKVLNAADGSLVESALIENADQFITTPFGETYLQDAQVLIPWLDNEGNILSSKSIMWVEHEKYSLTNPSNIGITPHGNVWYFFGSYQGNLGFASDTRLVWLDENSRMLTNSGYATRNSLVVGVDQQDVLYTCGNKDFGRGVPSCQAFSFRQEQPLWEIDLEFGFAVNGGAVVDNRLYISTEDGYLYAVGGDTLWKDEKLAEMHLVSSLSDSSNGEGLDLQYFSKDLEPDYQKLLIDSDGFSGSPVVDENQIIYITSPTGKLQALSLDGEAIWEVDTGIEFMGDLVQDSQGRLTASASNGHIYWFSTDGELLQTFEPSVKMGLISEMIIDQNDDLYLTVTRSGRGMILAVSAAGEEKWLQSVKSVKYYHPPAFSSTQSYIFFDGEIFDAVTGEIHDFNLAFKVDRFIGGLNGRDYAVTQNTIAPMQILPNGVSVSEEGVIIDFLTSAGGNIDINIVEDGSLLFKTRRSIIWHAQDGEFLGSNFVFDSGLYEVLTYENDLTAYVCGYTPDSYGSRAKIFCGALETMKSEEDEGAAWRVMIDEEDQEYAGAVILPGRIIIASQEGILGVITDPAFEEEGKEPSTEPTSQLLIGSVSPGPQKPVFSSILQSAEGFSGGLAADDTGMLYIPSSGNFIYAADTVNQTYWKIPTPTPPAKKLMLTSDGYLISASSDGSLFKISLDGELQWHFQPEITSGLLAALAVDSSGSSYYAYHAGTGTVLQAVSAEGSELWHTELENAAFINIPEITKDGNFIFVKDKIYLTSDGSQIAYDLPIEVTQLLVGEDGRNYLKSENTFFPITVSLNGITLAETSIAVNSTQTQYQNFIPSFITKNSIIALTSLYEVYWFDTDGKSLGFMTASNPGQGFGPFYYGYPAIASNNVVYGCGTYRLDSRDEPQPLCSAFSPDEEGPLWTVKLDGIGEPFGEQSGGVLIDGLLYLSIENGNLIVIGTDEMEMFEMVDFGG